MISRAKIRIISETKKKMAGNFGNPCQVVLLFILADDLVFNLHNSKIKFYLRFCCCRTEIVTYHISHQFSTMF